jgi:hypothetical protein
MVYSLNPTGYLEDPRVQAGINWIAATSASTTATEHYRAVLMTILKRALANTPAIWALLKP